MSTADPFLKKASWTALPKEQRKKILSIRRELLGWYAKTGRHGLPWKSSDPYVIWVSEIMMQQTQVATGLIRFPLWVQRFPDLKTLAEAKPEEVLKAWEGLGYYNRASNLHKAAQMMMAEHGGKMPIRRGHRLALPGIGPSTASAIGAFAFGLREPVLDANVIRIWTRVIGRPLDVRTLWGWAFSVMPVRKEAEIRAWNQATMDLGATICKAKEALCDQCPLFKVCANAKAGGFKPAKVSKKGSKREVVLSMAWGALDERLGWKKIKSGFWKGLWIVAKTIEVHRTATVFFGPRRAGLRIDADADPGSGSSLAALRRPCMLRT